MKNITIKEIREQTGLSQNQFAKKFHLTIRVVQSWEYSLHDSKNFRIRE